MKSLFFWFVKFFLIAAFLIGTIFNMDFRYTTTEGVYEVEINGLLWVGLDHYSINEYQSDDIPMQPFTYTKKN